jgi:glutathionyl-hydroquinone reductase
MGHLENGVWLNPPRELSSAAFVRKPARFRRMVGRGGEFPAEPGRYHLYVALACPWASRATAARKLKKLEDVVSVTSVHPDMLENGWTFQGTTDPINGFQYLHQVYTAADPTYSGRVTVPVLWDREAATIVNNESSDIIRMLNREFDEWGDRSVDLYPQDLAAEIDALNERTYASFNNAVYRAGFSTSQASYQAAVWDIFALLEKLDQRLAAQRYLVGSRMTEADIRVFTTAVRFDAVYHGHFKCNVKHLWDFPNLWGWLLDMYQTPGIAETVDLDNIKRHYYASHRWVNPSGIVPVGPSIDLRAPHGRDRFTAANPRGARGALTGNHVGPA